MSDFKFACPVCGQHLTAAPGNSGDTIECPTCFRALVVPQAPSFPEGKLIMSAVLVGKPRPTQAALVPAAPPSQKDKRLGIAAGLLIGGLLCALGFALFGERLWRNTSRAVSESELRFQERLRNPTVPVWTLDPRAVRVASKPMTGIIRGQPFTCEKAFLRGNHLVFRQGTGSPPALAMIISMHSPVTNSLHIKFTPGSPAPHPQVVVRGKDERGHSSSQAYKSGSMIHLALEFGPANTFSGHAYVAAPDDARSFVSGTFQGEVVHPSAGGRSGRVERRP